MKEQTQPTAAGPQSMPAALLIEQMQGATLAARLDKIEKAICRLADSISTPETSAGPDFLSRKEAAALLGVTLVTLDDWRNKGILKAYKIGRRIYYKPAEISAAMIQKGGVL